MSIDNMRTCSLCKKQKTLSCFNGSLKSCNACRECQREYYRKNSTIIKKRVSDRENSVESKSKSKAYRSKYYQDNKDRLSAANKDWQSKNRERCNAKKRAYYAKHKDRVHRQRKAKKYGITVDQLEALEQIASCAICGQQLCWSPKTRGSNDAVIDHCHDSGDVRGVLCRKCNSGIGFLNDDVSTVRNALNYLEEADKEICDVGSRRGN